MPESYWDRAIMFCVIGLVAWGIIGAPLLFGPPISYQGPAEQTKQYTCPPNQTGGNSEGTLNGTASFKPQTQPDGRSEVNSCNCGCCCNQPEKGWWEKLWTDPNATFAGTIAFLTLALVVVGAFQVRINMLQYRATVVLESPNVTVAAVKLVEYANETAEASMRDPVIGGEFPDFARILVLIANSGRTDARIYEMCLEWLVALKPPGYPAYRNVTNGDLLLRAGEQIWVRFDPFGNVHLSELQRRTVRHGGDLDSLWAYGYFGYSDTHGSKLRRGFLVRWDYLQGFVPEVVPEYSYQR